MSLTKRYLKRFVTGVTFHDKTGKKISHKKFKYNQKISLFGTDAVIQLSKMMMCNPLIQEKDLKNMQDEGLIEIKKYKGKKYLSENEWSYAIKVLERRRINTVSKQSNLF